MADQDAFVVGIRHGALGQPTPQQAILSVISSERLPEGRDAEVSPALWRRLDAQGRVVVEFHVGVTSDGEYFLDGYRRCSGS